MATGPSTGAQPRRLGVILPSGNAVLERELPAALPDTVSAHYARVRLRTTSHEELAGLRAQAPGAAASLVDAGVDVIGFACTTGSLLGGRGYDTALVEAIGHVCGDTPVTTTATAVLQALEHLGVRRITLVTPYEDWLNEIEIDFLEEHGFEVVAAHGMALPESRDIEAVTPENIERLAIDVDRPDSDAVFISCTNLRALEAVERLERALRKPVVTSNQATLWRMLALAGASYALDGPGRLLTRG